MKLSALILGRDWELHYRSDFEAEHIGGITYFPSRKIYVRDDMGDEELLHVIVHEITHAYLYELGQSQNQLKKHQFDEEFICELMAIHGASIQESSRSAFKAIKTQKKISNKIYRAINKDISDRNNSSK